jgi:hypothetical protein
MYTCAPLPVTTTMLLLFALAAASSHATMTSVRTLMTSPTYEPGSCSSCSSSRNNRTAAGTRTTPCSLVTPAV